MSALGVYITLQNDEESIVECWRRVAKVFPWVVVCDLGSEDEGPSRALTAGAEVRSCGRVSFDGYGAWKNELSKAHSYVLWIDADEWWPEGSLLKILQLVESQVPYVGGYWRNLKREGDRLYVSELIMRGRIAWSTRLFEVRRAWPNEILRQIEGEPVVVDNFGHDPNVFCWHNVLLRRSSVPEDAARSDKRRIREMQFQDLIWTEIRPEQLF